MKLLTKDLSGTHWNTIKRKISMKEKLRYHIVLLFLLSAVLFNIIAHLRDYIVNGTDDFDRSDIFLRIFIIPALFIFYTSFSYTASILIIKLFISKKKNNIWIFCFVWIQLLLLSSGPLNIILNMPATRFVTYGIISILVSAGVITIFKKAKSRKTEQTCNIFSQHNI